MTSLNKHFLWLEKANLNEIEWMKDKIRFLSIWTANCHSLLFEHYTYFSEIQQNMLKQFFLKSGNPFLLPHPTFRPTGCLLLQSCGAARAFLSCNLHFLNIKMSKKKVMPIAPIGGRLHSTKTERILLFSFAVKVGRCLIPILEEFTKKSVPISKYYKLDNMYLSWNSSILKKLNLI